MFATLKCTGLPKNSSVAIVILNWNGKEFLERFLPSVINTDYSEFEVIVADNNSSDGSLEFLGNNFPNVKCIIHKENFGFARGYNEALKNVKADYFVLLNSDVQVSPGWLTPVISHMDSNINVGACQPKILSFENRNYFEYAGASGGWIDKYGYPFCRGRVFDFCEKDEGQYNEIANIFWASGAAFFIRSQVFFEMNGFDPYFFAHQEEIDLCWRIQLAGYKIAVVPESVVYHVGGGTLAQGNPVKTFYNFRNSLIMLAKNLTSGQSAIKLPLRLCLDQAAAFQALVSGKWKTFKAIEKAQFAFIKWKMSKHESQLNQQKRLEDLDGIYDGSIVKQYFINKKRRFSEIVSTKE